MVETIALSSIDILGISETSGEFMAQIESRELKKEQRQYRVI